ncbi:GspH/FimT family pseudopilin [Stenotrophomonas sp. 278]|uniref:GspH/FimT family pseudopilin n=1 Tax=Stenotrophomonas sp. 278 TaxID=2479851 RepID=UPI000F690100|nr:GspH/FimT family pseudopilin [Stenotrophomonas sp. 278]RRT99697.1 type II secretion system protein GspH [Stenotrophomonas sp. 278]
MTAAPGPHPSTRVRRRPRMAGFSLLEVLLVMAIAGMATTAVLLTLPDGDAALHRQADTLGTHLRRAKEQAVLGGRSFRVDVDAAGYRFFRVDHGHWLPYHDGPFRERRWTDGVSPVGQDDEQRSVFRFDPIGMAEPEALVLHNGRQRVTVAVQRSGKVILDAPAR